MLFCHLLGKKCILYPSSDTYTRKHKLQIETFGPVLLPLPLLLIKRLISDNISYIRHSLLEISGLLKHPKEDFTKTLSQWLVLAPTLGK